MRERKHLVMWRDDHIGDPVGAIFLGNTEDAARRLADYFGEKVRVLKVQVVNNRADIEVESFRLPDEARRLAATADELRAKGMIRSANAAFREALVLDPLNPEVLMGFANFFTEQKDHAAAFSILKRAREVGGDSVEVLRALAQASLTVDQAGAAVGYLRRAMQLAPNDATLEKALASLQPESAAEAGAADASDRGRKR